jgi:hypothetical protein
MLLSATIARGIVTTAAIDVPLQPSSSIPGRNVWSFSAQGKACG